MVARVFFICAWMTSFVSYSQDYIQPGLLVGEATFSPASMLNRNTQNFYLSGNLEYYVDKKVSFKGQSHLFLNGNDASSIFENRVSTYFGALYHFNRNNWDQHIGFSPGVSVTKSGIQNADGNQYPVMISPSFALEVGTTYFVWKYFNFFARITYLNSKLSGTHLSNQRTDELMISVGLGFQVPTRKK